MTKDDEKQIEASKPTEMELEQAVKIVNAAIRKEEERYRKIANSDDQEPVLVEGCTTTNYNCQLMVDPKTLAHVLLHNEYPTWKILGTESPDSMWEDLGKIYGLEYVTSFDL